MRTGKVILSGIAAGATIIIIAAIILATTIDPNEYKAEVSNIIKEETGRDFQFTGDITLSFFPWIGFETGPLTLGNSKGFAGNMAEIKRAEVSLQIIPLLSGQISIGEVVLEDLQLNLAKNKKGVSNWDDLLQTSKKDIAVVSEKKKAEKESQGFSVNEISLQGFLISNANIHWDDQQANEQTSLEKATLTIGAINGAHPFDFSLEFDIKSTAPVLNTHSTLGGRVTLDLANGNSKIENLNFSFLNLKILGNLYAAELQTTPSFSGEFKISEFDPRAMMEKMQMEIPTTSNPEALTSASGEFSFDGTPKSINLKQLTARLDNTTLTATASVKLLKKIEITAQCNIDALDVDAYLPSKAQQDNPLTKTTESQKTKKETQQETSEPDLRFLGDYVATAKMTMGKLKVTNLNLTDILLNLNLQNGILKVTPFQASLYEGKMEAQATLNAQKSIATWTKKAQLSNFQAGPFLKDYMGKDHILGTTNAKFNLAGTGLTSNNIKKSITGTASFAFTDGAITGVNVAKMLRDTMNTLTGKKASAEEPTRTDFAELVGSAAITKGHIVNKDLLMKSPLLRVSGKGWADLPTEKVDYLATILVVGTLKGQDGQSMETLSGVPIPLYIKGSMLAPEMGVDKKALTEALFGDTFKKGTKKIEEKIKNGLLEKLF